MHIAALTFVCLAFTSRARRVLTLRDSSSQESQDAHVYPAHQAGVYDPLKGLAIALLRSAFTPSAAWQVVGAGQSDSLFAHSRPMSRSLRHQASSVNERSVSISMSSSANVAAAQATESGQAPDTSTERMRQLTLVTDEEEYRENLLDATEDDRIIVNVFSSRTCRMCRAMVPKLQRVAARFPWAEFYSIDFDKNKDLCRSLGILELPHVEVIGGKKGKEAAFTCTKGEISNLLTSLESYGESHGDVAQTKVSPVRPTFPLEWEPYLTNVEIIGEGNFGKVFSMELTCPGGMPVKVAMKDMTEQMDNKQLIAQEIQAMTSLRSFLRYEDERREKAGIDDTYSAYCETLLAEPKLQDGHWYMPMPFCNKGELKDIYENAQKRESFGGDAGMYAFLLHVARGVKALHAAGWVHNDLHGRNVMVTCSTQEVPSSCYASIIDLGLASNMSTEITGIRGYRHSISPEVVAMGKAPAKPNPKSDVWALGMLLWELRLGKEATPTRQIADDGQIADGGWEEVVKLIPTLDFKDAPFEELEGEPEIQSMLRGMLTQDPAERWDLDRVIAELEKVALPDMLGPHDSAWENAACLINPIIPNGSIIEIVGLRSRTAQALNGYMGVVLQYMPSSRAYEIRLNDDTVKIVPERGVRVIE